MKGVGVAERGVDEQKFVVLETRIGQTGAVGEQEEGSHERDNHASKHAYNALREHRQLACTRWAQICAHSEEYTSAQRHHELYSDREVGLGHCKLAYILLRLPTPDDRDQRHATDTLAEVIGPPDTHDELWDLENLRTARRLCDWMFAQSLPFVGGEVARWVPASVLLVSACWHTLALRICCSSSPTGFALRS